MKKFLVSFCNNQLNINQESSLGLLAQLEIFNDKFQINHVSLPFSGFEKLIGTTGVTYAKGNYYVIGQSKYSQLLVLDEQLSLTDCIDLYPHKGVHSLVFFNNSLYMVVTKHDKVIKCNIDENYTTEVIYSLNTESDTHHLNSICIHQNSLIVSGFGNNENELWMHAENGYILNILNNKVIKSGFKQPHSLFVFDNKVLLCDSSRKRVVDLQGKIYFQTNKSYVRGLYKDNEIALIGHSKGRVRSHTHNKFVGNIADKGILSGECGISIIINNKNTFLSLEDEAEEIYDIYPMMN